MPIERAGLVQGTLEMLIHKALAPATHVQAFREQRAVASEGSRRVRPFVIARLLTLLGSSGWKGAVVLALWLCRTRAEGLRWPNIHEGSTTYRAGWKSGSSTFNPLLS